jgi:hypothetical protein
MEEPEYIGEAEDHLKELTATADKLFVTLPDLGMSAVEFEAALQEFLREVWAIRKRYVTIAGCRIAIATMSGKQTSVPKFKFPKGAGISINESGDDAITVHDDPYQGLFVGSFWGPDFNQKYSPSRIRLCGRKHVFGNQVSVEVVPCELPLNIQHNENENCISSKWLQTLPATDTEDDSSHTQSGE